MLTPRTTLARRVTAALDASPSRIPVLLGGCGSGRTTLLRQLRDRIGRTSVQHIDVERTATTPERFLRAVTAVAPFPITDAAPASANARAAFDATLGFLGRARTPAGDPQDPQEADYLARTVNALADGRPAYVRALADELATMREHGGAGGTDAISALAALLATDGRLAKLCSFCYELRLHRARGYGALKAILEILAEEEGLTLTEISQRLQRTPGSTKDYLSWLEDVDLVVSRQKRYSFTDPLLRAWVRLHCRASAPSEDDLAREVHRYALPRLPQAITPPPAPKNEPAFAMAGGPSSGIIEID